MIAAAIIVHSVMFSQFPSLSVFKAVFWGVVSLTLVSTMRAMTEEEFEKLHRFLLVFFAGILLLSIAIMPLPEARLRNDVGLQGLLNHPQMFGVFCGITGAYFFGTAISKPVPPWWALAVVVLALEGVVESAARTGGFALVLACVAITGIAAVRSTSFFRRTLPGLFSGRFGVLAFFAFLALVLNSAVVKETANKFLRKDARGTQATATYNAERQFIIRDMYANIQKHPAAGIGLGIQSATHLMEIETDATTGLPISAPVEKGVMWLAMLEELGLFLGILVFGWVLWGTARAVNVGAAVGTASIAYFFTNFAEATFFSPGATGMLGLIIFHLGLARGQKTPEAAPAQPEFAWPAADMAPPRPQT